MVGFFNLKIFLLLVYNKKVIVKKLSQFNEKNFKKIKTNSSKIIKNSHFKSKTMHPLRIILIIARFENGTNFLQREDASQFSVKRFIIRKTNINLKYL